MNQVLRSGQKVRLQASGAECRVEQFLGGGGQGEVYRASMDGNAVALKWYYPEQATPEQRAALEVLIRKGPPNDRFLWPTDLADGKGITGFGYVMPLREPRFKGIVDLMKRRIEPSFRSLATAALGLAHSYLQLHSKGLCYRDISFGNVFFDPQDGDILICDNDNVSVDGSGRAGVLGTPRFMAPEVVRGEALPSTQTDLFSLAVLLFYMLVVHHPLEGAREASIRCFDLPAMTKIYGTDPLFIFDPSDYSNRPVKGYQDNALVFWPIFPTFLRNLFTRAFTDGIKDPQNGRVRESEWRAAMVRLRDSILYCSCGTENFYDADALQATGKPGACWACKGPLSLPYRIRIGSQVVMLNHDTRLHPHHTDTARAWDFSAPTAEVTRHPANPSVWGLKNLSGTRWNCSMPDGRVADIDPGRSVTLAAGTRVQFAGVEGEIRGG